MEDDEDGEQARERTAETRAVAGVRVALRNCACCFVCGGVTPALTVCNGVSPRFLFFSCRRSFVQVEFVEGYDDLEDQDDMARAAETM